jgi:flagellar biosynthesis/type III secretory pathway M-ring protein FliF/YscJ
MAKRESGKDLLSQMTGWEEEPAENTSQPGEVAHRAKRRDDEYERHFEREKTVSVATRLTEAEQQALKQYAIQEQRRVADILRDWIRERMSREGVS